MAARARRRLQFSLLSLFALTTATCLVLTWWVWPEPVEVISLVQASTAPIPVSAKAGPPPQSRFVCHQQELLTALSNPELLNGAIRVAGNGDLRMLRDRSDPASWLRKRLEIKVLKTSMVSIKLTVPERFRRDAVEVVDYITFKAVADTTVKVGRHTREHVRRLHEKERALEQVINKTSQRLSRLGNAELADRQQAAALDVVLKSQLESLKQLRREIELARRADVSSTHLHLVQTATVAAAGN